ncbi:MAG: phosphoglucosamine mutase, partial [Candidatus Latescibacterota bacterium]
RAALHAGLAASGCPVLDSGVCPTPSVLLAVSRRAIGGGVLVTASHNPIEWNALKFVGADGFFLAPEAGEELARRFREGSPEYVRFDRVGRVEAGPDVETEHLEAVLALPWIDAERVRARRWKVALDGTGGAASRLALRLLERLGCEVEPIHCEATGSFPRPPEPRPENLGDLSALVARSGAAAGFALDPDGDRLSLVAAGGAALSEERTLAVAVDFVLARRRGPVAVNLSTSRAVEDLAARYGVPFERSPVGEAHVAALMRRTGAVVGGEGNGGVMVAALHPMRDAAVGIAIVLQAMTDSGRSLAALDGAIPSYAMRKKALAAETPDGEKISRALRERFGEGRRDERDGIRVEWEKSWVQVRASNTEPVVRLLAEAPTIGEAEELLGTAERAILS